MARDFEPPPGTTSGTWWNWKPAKAALDLLFWTGELMISERRKFQKVYDLTERVLPDRVDTRIPDDEELGRFFVNRALNGLAIAREKDILEYIDTGNKKILAAALKEMAHNGEVCKVSVNGIHSGDYYTLPRTLEIMDVPVQQDRALLLSPFDNLVILRDRVNRLFNFTYTLECYVPFPKRVYGYFVLPILLGNRFIGRLDATADRKNKILNIHALHLEPGFVDEDIPGLVTGIHDFAGFHKTGQIRIKSIFPVKYTEPILTAFK